MEERRGAAAAPFSQVEEVAGQLIAGRPQNLGRADVEDTYLHILLSSLYQKNKTLCARVVQDDDDVTLLMLKVS